MRRKMNKGNNLSNPTKEKRMLFTQQQFDDAVNAQAQKRAAEMKKQLQERMSELDKLIEQDREEHNKWMKWSNKADIAMVILGIIMMSLILITSITTIISTVDKSNEDTTLKDSCIRIIEDYL